MGILKIQNDFTHGELDRRLFARSDIEVYSKAAQELTNVVIIPQGGARRRFGSLYIQSIDETAGRYEIRGFSFSPTVNYLFLLEPEKLTILKDDVVVATITVGIPWTAQHLILRQLEFTQTTNLMIITNEDFIPVQISRGADDTQWTVLNITFKNPPTTPFVGKDYSDFNFTLSEVSIGQDRTLTSDTDIFAVNFVDGIFRAVGPPTSAVRIGVARIKGFLLNPKEVVVDIVSTFDDSLKTAPGIKGSNVDLEIPAVSATFGWPKAATFYEGRLWFGGTKAQPSLLFGSVVNDFSNFDTGTGDDDESIQINIASEFPISIKYLLGDKSLQIFTNRAEFAAPQENERALTPTNISLRTQTSNGISNVEPITLDNQTFYVTRGAKRVMGFSYNNVGASYQSVYVSVLSPSTIRNPEFVTTIQGSATDDADYLIYSNEDGTLAIFQSLKDENVAAWTLSELEDEVADAKFQSLATVADTVYCILERADPVAFLVTENQEPIITEDDDEILVSQEVLHELVKFSFDAYTDSGIQQKYGTATTTITGLDHLDGKKPAIRGEFQRGEGFFVLQPAKGTPDIVIGGSIELEHSVEVVEVGLGFTSTVQPMPVELLAQQGPTLYIPKRLIRIMVDFYESVGIFINGSLIPYWELGPDVLDKPPPITSDLFEFKNLGGWDRRQAPILTQPNPMPFTILGIGYEVEI